MVACTKCSTENSLDSLFCRQCGEAIAADQRSDAQQKNESLIAEGYKIFNEGRTAEARLVAEATLAENPNSTSALSLKGMCHERSGELAEALAVYERVVELNPDSALDKIKVTHLRQSISGRTLVEEPPRRGRALMGAAAAAVLVVAVGVALASSQPPAPRVAMKGAAETPQTSTDTFNEADYQNQASNPGPTEKPAAPVTQPNVNAPNPSTQNPPTSNPGMRYTPPRGPATPLPNVGLPTSSQELEGPIGSRPVILAPPKNLSLTPELPAKSSDEGPDPKITAKGADTTDGGNTEPKEDPAVIEIKVSNPRPNSPGGSAPISSENGTEALLKAANQQFLLGKFSQAAGTYESALRSGASSGSTNQRIAQCYANSGNRSAAQAAYRRAISSYEASISSGNDSPRLRSALESCRQALKVLGG